MTKPRRSRSERGSAMVEGALCLTVFLVMVFGIMDFGRAVFAYNSISWAAREGARYAIVRGSSSGHQATATDVKNYVLSRTVGMVSSDLGISTTWTPDASAGSTVSVAVTYSFTPFGPYMPVGPWNLKSTSKMIIAQ
jgi:Flp pilus assembly protein TadG